MPQPAPITDLNADGTRLLCAAIIADSVQEYRALEKRGLVSHGHPTASANRTLRSIRSRSGGCAYRIGNHIHAGAHSIKDTVDFLKSHALDAFLVGAGTEMSGTAVRLRLGMI